MMLGSGFSGSNFFLGSAASAASVGFGSVASAEVAVVSGMVIPLSARRAAVRYSGQQ
jgi:hypothetical protein